MTTKSQARRKKC